jgi:cobalt/nickel transport system ATP-binding protein
MEVADKPPHHLSAGQKRAAAIATVLSMSPKIITLDEPNNSLDARSRNNISGIIKELSQTVIIATCDINFAADFAERVILIDEGQKVADGDSKRVMSDDKLMASHGLEVPWKYRN